MRCGCDAWLMLVQPASHVVDMEADTCAGAGEGSGQLPETTHWKKSVDECANVFEPTGMPVDCETVHRIKLKPGAMHPFRH